MFAVINEGPTVLTWTIALCNLYKIISIIYPNHYYCISDSNLGRPIKTSSGEHTDLPFSLPIVRPLQQLDLQPGEGSRTHFRRHRVQD